MRTGSANNVIDNLRRAVPPDQALLSDADLLECFLQSQDESAFSTLVKRHGPMVWGVCRRLLLQHDAEDAFQATFLVLARKAASIRSKATMGNWLYGVAHQTALQTRRTIARRKAREIQVTTMPDIEAGAFAEAAGLHPILDEELSRLPDIYRVVIVLCELEGLTRKKVAGKLGVPEGTVAGRLARARALLAKRLAHRGVTFSGSVAALFSAGSATSAPPSLFSSTIKAVYLLGTGQTVGIVTAKVVGLTEEVVKTMLLSKIKTVLSIALVLGILVTGTTFLTYRPATGQEEKEHGSEKRGEPVVKPHKEEVKEPFTAWGKEISGLEAGLGYLPGQKRAYHPCEKVTLVVRVRNVSQEEKKFKYLHQFFNEIPPVVTDPQGNPVRLWAVTTFGRHIPVEVILAPGKEVELHQWMAEIEPASENNPEKQNFRTLFGPGKFQVQYPKVIGNSSSGIVSNKDPNLSNLATGKLEIEVKDKQKSEKEPFTVWGKEAGGLQAGLGYLPGEKRIYYPGETATLVVRVRNAGQDEVKFQYLPQFFSERPPAVTDSQGNPVRLGGTLAPGKMHIPVDVILAPGKEVELFKWTVDIQSANGKFAGKPTLSTLFGPGRFQIQYEKVIANSSAGFLNNQDPNLSMLATGKLDLEVKEADDKKPQEDKEPGKPQVVFTTKNVTIDQVDEKAKSISVTLGSGEKRTKLVNLPINAGTRVVASHVFPGVANNLPFSWDRLKRLEGKVVSLRLCVSDNEFLLESIAWGND